MDSSVTRSRDALASIQSLFRTSENEERLRSLQVEIASYREDRAIAAEVDRELEISLEISRSRRAELDQANLSESQLQLRISEMRSAVDVAQVDVLELAHRVQKKQSQITAVRTIKSALQAESAALDSELAILKRNSETGLPNRGVSSGVPK